MPNPPNIFPASCRRKAALEVEEVGEWGNRECIVGNLSRWSAYRRWHSLRNDPDLAVQVWAFARNSAVVEIDGQPEPQASTGP